MSRRTQLLLLGNGINCGYAKNPIPLSELLKKASIHYGVDNIPDDLKMPFPLEVVLRTHNHVDEFLKENKSQLYGRVDSEEYKHMLKRILDMGFDEILTTNYSYELEAAFNNQEIVRDSFLDSIAKNMLPGKKVEPKYLIHSCNVLKNEEQEKHIWHIHGEAKKTNSMIIGHDYYSRLLSRLVTLINRRGQDYQKAWIHEQNIGYSWIDRFIQSDVYILGFGFYPSEMDLWWLLESRNRITGKRRKLIFYGPDHEKTAFNPTINLIRVYGGQIKSLDIKTKGKNDNMTDEQKKQIDEENNDIYKHFYECALDDIKSNMRINRELSFEGEN